MNDKDKMIQ